ncbi:hypothetical protein BDZ97DRAFT_2001799 [Flammula alnicola]|nr:hypothetical protein BDZ97DRAFT_2001799 [Flammula alnicola]
MVSADNLNLDVLELIFGFLSGNDLPSVALVSRSFLAGVIPRLYNTISYRLRQAKGYSQETMSPFAALIAHPHLAVHVRNIEIREVSTVKLRVHLVFARECRDAIRLCRNLKTFKCTVPGVLATFLPSLQDKHRLESVRIHANLTTDQAQMLLKMNKLQSLSVEEFAMWNAVDLLPSWTQSLVKTLTSLCLYMINELHEGVLEGMLSHLPNLLGLHVVGCPKVDHVVVLQQIPHTPLLQSLSLTTSESTRPLYMPPPSLRHLRHMAFDTRYTM